MKISVSGVTSLGPLKRSRVGGDSKPVTKTMKPTHKENFTPNKSGILL
jgi:hypothetical protein